MAPGHLGGWEQGDGGVLNDCGGGWILTTAVAVAVGVDAGAASGGTYNAGRDGSVRHATTQEIASIPQLTAATAMTI